MFFLSLIAMLPTETGGVSTNSLTTIDCSSVGDIGKLVSFARFIVDIIKIAIPIGMILIGSIDLARAVMAGKEEEIKKYQSRLGKRAIYAVGVFFVIAIVTAVFQYLGDEKWRACWNGEPVKICFNDVGDEKSCSSSDLFKPGYVLTDNKVKFVCGTSSIGIDSTNCLRVCTVDGDSTCSPSIIKASGAAFTASDKEQTVCALTKNKNSISSNRVCIKLKATTSR